MEPSGQIIPTTYRGDRFFATLPLVRGDTVSFFLDTGGGTLIWEPYLPYLELASSQDTVTFANATKAAVAPFPKLRDGAVLPPILVAGPQGDRLVVRPMDYRRSNNFASWIGRESQAQLGSLWFNGRVWTFDYPDRRLTFHDRTPPPRDPRERELALHFFVDSMGRRVGNVGYVDVVIDGDTVTLLMDTGATIWLSSDAMRQVDDGAPAERAATHINGWLFDRLRKRHPDWPVVERADLWSGEPIMQVPSVSIAGYASGPTWLSSLGGSATPPAASPTAPAWTRRLGGTIGGSVLRDFVVTLDYPSSLVRLRRP